MNNSFDKIKNSTVETVSVETQLGRSEAGWVGSVSHWGSRYHMLTTLSNTRTLDSGSLCSVLGQQCLVKQQPLSDSSTAHARTGLSRLLPDLDTLSIEQYLY